MMANFSLKTLAEDVLTLEINTIVKADMSACKMPTSRREALWGLAGDYHVQLVELQCREPMRWGGAGLMAFLEFYDRANAGIRATEQLLGHYRGEHELARIELREKLMMLQRIKTQSEQLVSIFADLARTQGIHFELGVERNTIEERAQAAGLVAPMLTDLKSAAWNNDLSRHQMQTQPDLQLNTSQLSVLRKAWEIGTERILLQSVIHADGDVSTRIAERLLVQQDLKVLQIHNQAVSTSVQFWSNLIKTIGEIATSFMTGSKSFLR